MKNKIQNVAVLGAGVMGAQLAAHFSNAGVPSFLFDISQEIAEKGLEAALQLRPTPFYNPKTAASITPRNYDTHLDQLREVDWVIEAIIERLDVKQSVFSKIAPFLKDDAIVSSNTSGISIVNMMAEMPTEFRERFLVTHFFNPPRYMRLVEIVGDEQVRPEYIQRVTDFCENVLGKGVVNVKDTPNFIANRIGVFGMMLTLKLTQQMKLSVEEVDKLTGTIIGRPKSATYRTADVVGLDTLAHVSRNTHEFCPNDESRDVFLIPDFLDKILEQGWLGQKTKKGFYQKIGRDILSLDLNTLEHGTQKQVRFDGYRLAKSFTQTADRIHALAYSDDPAGKFFWEILAGTLIYTANRIPEISEDISNVDNAMKWGFGWELGPFETWDAIGVERSVKKMDNEGKKPPAWIFDMLDSGIPSFYGRTNGQKTIFDTGSKVCTAVEPKTKEIDLALLKEGGAEIDRNWCASLLDIGDDVVCLEFHSALQAEMNPIDPSIIDMMVNAFEFVSNKGLRGLVIGHQGKHFSAGANLALIIRLCEAQDWKGVESISKSFQDITQKLKFAPFPVVSVPFNMCLGGGYEAAACADRMVASAELYCGLVEVGVGIIPGAGGNLRLILNNIAAMSKAQTGPFPIVQKAFETIGFARVSTSAKEAMKLGYLRRDDAIILNPAHLLYAAKKTVIELSEDYNPPEPKTDIALLGVGGRRAIEGNLDDMVKAGKISKHDRLIGKKLAYVLTGGEKAGSTVLLGEQAILDLEREAFLSLCGEKLSLDRMKHMLAKGKPLRN